MMLITAYEIANNYPEQIQITHAGPDDKGKFACFMYRLKGDTIHKLIVSSEPVFDTAEDAEKRMHELCKNTINYVKSLTP